jgi:CMP-N-acetylneuraminic acid synthetase
LKIFIPIKKDSQRVPNKNFRFFGGHPLWFHFLNKFKDDEVYVDTDCPELIKTIRSFKQFNNVIVYERPSDLKGHQVSVCKLIENFISKFNVTEIFVQLHVTNPFLERKTVVDAFKSMGSYDSVASCNQINSRFWRKEDYGFVPINHNPLKLEQTQDLPTLYEENSCFYIMKPETFLRYGRIGNNPFFYHTNFPQNIDIDTEADWSFATTIHRCINE